MLVAASSPASRDLRQRGSATAAKRQEARVTIDFPYPGYQRIAPVEVPDEMLMGVYSPRTYDHVDEQRALREGFDQPIGAQRLRDAVKPTDSVLVLIDDGTRMTPTARILPHVIVELHAAGVDDDRIEFLQAPGTHRPMTAVELKQKL